MTIRSVLIANRGEIAIRIARTARRMAIRAIGVYSDADRDAEHVRSVDEAIPIGGLTAAESYLRGDVLIAAAKAVGADAIHPGYGFLSENAAFARACAEAGLIFIGPPPEAIEAMGDKALARQRMKAEGVAVIDGYDGEDQSLAKLSREAERIGYPVMIKASAGGGGRGMRLVDSAAGFAEAVEAAANEAEKAFGNPRLLLERAVIDPRHVEIQVFADQHGHVLHLGERDCSVQRRHQKIVEEAPSPAVDAALRTAMGQAAVTAARSVGYVGAGTIEFLLDRDKRFTFMEMNTRLQVEHPVTEMITGFDLVEWQFRIAQGEALPVEQQDVRWSGHAIEVRLTAEDPAEFLPQTGDVLAFCAPEGVRFDHALRTGASVTPFYDSMVGKLIAHGATRDEARRTLIRALDDVSVLGLKTNRTFLKKVLADEVFAAGGATTAFIAQRFPDAAARADHADASVTALALALLAVGAGDTPPMDGLPRNWTSRGDRQRPFVLEGPGGAVKGRVTSRGDAHACAFGDAVITVTFPADPVANRPLAALCDGRGIAYRFCVTDRDERQLYLQTAQGDFVFVDRTLTAAKRMAAEKASNPGEVRAPMHAKITSVRVGAGQTIAKGDIVASLEAMKLEHSLFAACNGTIVAVHVGVGEAVSPGKLLIEIQPAEE